MRSVALLVIACVAVPLAAQTSPLGTQDARFRTIDYGAGSAVRIETHPETTQTILFAPGEHIATVILSNPRAFQVSVAAGGNSIAIRASGLTSAAALDIRTDQRQYALDLSPGATDPRELPLVISFSYGPLPQRVTSPPPPPALLPQVSYRISGSKALRPATIGDDGAKTYIVWRDDQPIPAVFALGPSGSEEMVNGYVRGGRFTIDRVYDELLFRIDTEVTRAQRQTTEGAARNGR